MKKLLIFSLFFFGCKSTPHQKINLEITYQNGLKDTVIADFFSNDYIKISIKENRVFINAIPTQLYNVEKINKLK